MKMQDDYMNYAKAEKVADEIYSNIKCQMKNKDSILNKEKLLKILLFELGCALLKLFLTYNNKTLSMAEYLSENIYRIKKKPVKKILKTSFGEVCYYRIYLINNIKSAGIYPLDIQLGILRDGFSALVIEQTCRLATRMSYNSSILVYSWFNGWSPSCESVECLVLGLGRKAGYYMDIAPPPEGDGETLVIEIDGKATPTATKIELEKRRGPRKSHKRSCSCGCQRHRGKSKRSGTKKNRKKKGDKSKNGKSITLVAMYTLIKGEDGKLHGPINKIIWGSYNTRKVMFEWVRKQSIKRGFDPATCKNIQLIMDGEKCLEKRLKEIFPLAIFTLDIRHLEEKIWDLGRSFHKEGSEELAEWVSERKEKLYEGKESELLSELKMECKKLSKRAKRDEKKRESMQTLINYMSTRITMMNYKDLFEKDLVVASGIIEGAARYIVGERMDCSGMRWIPGRAEALLHLRCIELNGDWDIFFDWAYNQWTNDLQNKKIAQVRSSNPIVIDKDEAA